MIPAVIRRCMDFGASGFDFEDAAGVEAMRGAISRACSRGGVWTPPDVGRVKLRLRCRHRSRCWARLETLTPQQVGVLMMLSEGLLNKQIAYELDVSEATVKAHVSAILQKLGVESRTQAVIAAAKIETGQWSQGARGGGIAYLIPPLVRGGSIAKRDRGGVSSSYATTVPHPARFRSPPSPQAGRDKKAYSAAATRITRHCAKSARSAAGLSGLFSSWMPCARATSRTAGERSAVIRIAGRSP